MICKKEGCEKPVTGRGQAYCSAPHAPYSFLNRAAAPSKSEVTARLNAPARGAQSVQSSVGGQTQSASESLQALRQAKNIMLQRGVGNPRTERNVVTRGEVIMQNSAQTRDENSTDEGWNAENAKATFEKPTTPGIPVISPPSSQESRPHGSDETQPEGSTRLLASYEQVTSESLNLIDSTANDLRNLMQRLHPSSDSPCNPQTVNAACNLGKQIYQMARLKLDAIKYAEKLKRGEA